MADLSNDRVLPLLLLLPQEVLVPGIHPPVDLLHERVTHGRSRFSTMDVVVVGSIRVRHGAGEANYRPSHTAEA